MSGDTSTLIQLGAVGAPFGVRGWIKLRSDTDPPERLLEYPVWSLASTNECREYEVQTHGRTSGQLTVKLAGINDRDAAARLTGASIMVPRDQLPPPASNEFYRADLIGCDVETLTGQQLGKVQYFIETPAHAVMVIVGQTETWMPAVADHIRRVDLKARRVLVEWEDMTADGAED